MPFPYCCLSGLEVVVDFGFKVIWQWQDNWRFWWLVGPTAGKAISFLLGADSGTFVAASLRQSDAVIGPEGVTRKLLTDQEQDTPRAALNWLRGRLRRGHGQRTLAQEQLSCQHRNLRLTVYKPDGS